MRRRWRRRLGDAAVFHGNKYRGGAGGGSGVGGKTLVMEEGGECEGDHIDRRPGLGDLHYVSLPKNTFKDSRNL